jgi:hypothetical protein
MSAAFGILWLLAVLASAIHRFIANELKPLDNIFLLAVVPMMAIPGVLAIFFGIKLYRTISLSSLKWVTGIFATFGALWISSGLSSLFKEFIPNRIQSGLFLLVGIFVVVPIYLIVVRHLSRRLGMGRLKVADLMGKGALALIAWQLWMVLFAVLQEYSPKEKGYTSIAKEPWGMIELFVPILVSYTVYRVAVARWFSPQAESGHDNGNANASAAPNVVPPPPK